MLSNRRLSRTITMPATNLESADYRRITVTPIAGALGAEIGGVDLADPRRRDRRRDPCRRGCAHLVVFFHDQDARQRPVRGRSPSASASRSSTRSCRGFDDHPEIIAVTKLPTETVNFGGIWHSDTDVPRRAADGHDAARPRDPAVRWRHDVRQPVRRLRSAVAGDAGAARSAARRSPARRWPT